MKLLRPFVGPYIKSLSSYKKNRMESARGMRIWLETLHVYKKQFSEACFFFNSANFFGVCWFFILICLFVFFRRFVLEIDEACLLLPMPLLCMWYINEMKQLRMHDARCGTSEWNLKRTKKKCQYVSTHSPSTVASTRSKNRNFDRFHGC